jgi:hypothetical protein
MKAERSDAGGVMVVGVHLGTVALDWMPLFNREARVIPSLGYCAAGAIRVVIEPT